MAPKNGIIHEKKLFSRELEEEMTVLVYLPNTYSPCINIIRSSPRTAMITSD